MSATSDIILQNGRNHLRAAELLADKQYWGFAVAHIVLGAEELIKYVVLHYYSSCPSPISENDIVKLFSSHSAKHRLWKEFKSMLSDQFEKTYVDALFLSLSDGAIDKDQRAVLENRFRDMSAAFAKLTPRLGLTATDYEQFKLWIGNADTQKQNGFYVDKNVDGYNGPEQISKSDYETTLKYVKALENSAIQINTISDDLRKKFESED